MGRSSSDSYESSRPRYPLKKSWPVSTRQFLNSPGKALQGFCLELYITSDVTLAFEEMRTPYRSGQDICLQIFGNAYQRKYVQKWMTHFKSTFTTRFIKRFSKIKCSQTMRAFLSQYSSAFRGRSCRVLFNPFTPKFKKYNLPNFQKKNV